MNPLMQQIYSLLISETGSLAYHLVLAFSVMGALILTLSLTQKIDLHSQRRVVLGLSILLFIQFVQFILSGLGWQGVIASNKWLPLAASFMSLLSLLVIIWLWVFPKPSSIADAAALILGGLIIVAAIFGAIYWNIQPGQRFNYSIQDFVVQVLSLALIVIGCLLLVIRKTEGWILGIVMLAILAIGSIAHLIFIIPDSDFSSFVRLSQMAAYPFLLILPLRFIEDVRLSIRPELADGTLPSRGTYARQAILLADPRVWQALSKLAIESNPDQVCRIIVSTLTKLCQVDYCLLVDPPDEQIEVRVICGYDRARGQYLQDLLLDGNSVPSLISTYRTGRIHHIAADHPSPDLDCISQALKLDDAGTVMFVPVLSSGGETVNILVMFSIQPDKVWTEDDESFLKNFAKLLVQFLQRSQEMFALKYEINHLRRTTVLAQEQAQSAIDERSQFKDQVTVLQEESNRDRAQLDLLIRLISERTSTQKLIDQLKAENQGLKEAFKSVSEQTQLTDSSVRNEMRLVLEELAYYKSLLSSAEKKILRMEASQAEGMISQDLASVANITQDIRQPLISIASYVNILLTESTGILVASQREQLERIRVSTERMTNLLEELENIASESEITLLAREKVDFNGLIQMIIREVNQQLGDKRLEWEVELPKETLWISADQLTLRRIFSHLIRNAHSVTPQGEQIAICARIEDSEENQNYLFFRITDMGGGIDPQHISQVFSRQLVGEPVSGIGENGAILPEVRNLVEALGGRVYVDSVAGVGATFSVLLPFSPANSS